MINTDQIQGLMSSGATVIGTDGEKIGKFGQVFLDDRTGEAEWVTVSTGLFGMSESFVPLSEATLTGDTLQVPYDKQMVKDAPRIDNTEGHLSQAEEQELYRYYNRAYDQSPEVDVRETQDADPLLRGDSAQHVDRGDRDVQVGGNDGSMTRSEEQLHVGTENVETGRARLRKYVVTENVETTVPVSHEEVRLEREPINDANASGTTIGDDLTSEEQEVTLHAERPVVDKETVPVERVRLDTETVTEEERVNEQVRKERIETEGLEGEDPDSATGEFRKR